MPRRRSLPVLPRRRALRPDTRFDTIAHLALGDTEMYARGFFEPTGREAGTGAYTS